MPTKPVLPITELDFFQAKNQLREFLRNDPSGRFRDIDFEGSNMSVLLDVLAYNTYQNNFYTNMAISEMFLDSAQLENSVVSHAKELNYLPRSRRSSMAIIRVEILDAETDDATITIPENTRFTTKENGIPYNFYTNETYVARRIPGSSKFVAERVEIFEGEIIEERFFVTGDRKSIRLINENIDTSSIKVFEDFDQPAFRIEYKPVRDIFGVGSNDPVFFVEPSFDNTYEILFGDNRFGRSPPNDEQITVFYRITNGSEANGACNFVSSFMKNVSISTLERSTSGSERETLEETKFYAPKTIQIQERAVTAFDYKHLLKQEFNEIQDVSVYGGDELDPPQYGKVAISINVNGGLSNIASQKYETFLKEKTPLAIQPIFLPPEFLYVDMTVDIFYSSKLTAKSKGEIERKARELIASYNKEQLNKFGAILQISRLSAMIDNLDPSIQSNTINAVPYILFSPDFNRKTNPLFKFDSSLQPPCRFALANKTESYNRFVQSSIFVIDGTRVLFEDNGLGVINILSSKERDQGIIDVVKRNAGTVDYQKGVISLSDFVVSSYPGEGIKVIANTAEKNVSSPKQRVLHIKDADIVVNVRDS